MRTNPNLPIKVSASPAAVEPPQTQSRLLTVLLEGGFGVVL